MNLSSTELQQSQRSVLQKRCSATKFNILKNTYSSFFSTKLKTEGYLLVYMDLIVFLCTNDEKNSSNDLFDDGLFHS